ncbi:peptidoglycan DD-metalloendopeptidase family protein [Nitrosomonas sp.]|uniref:peptidoglycan DD-metalloendopeptidase family protein n=1 Tax=Nitrosomonas sp. TaxID=42353 RepID=UPI001D3A3C9D|nr:peptidoglycan DD-metalloendopeptidase family protein [Nitrosomonas sp.]MBX3618091.1 peptidoglycan DD-metalloendopeptidase family protein [Nitrosomonas sp.]
MNRQINFDICGRVLRFVPFSGKSGLSSFYLLFAAGLFLVGCSTTQSPVPVVDREKINSSGPLKPTESANMDGQIYTVQRGDTLYGIALKYGIDFKKLVEWNEIVDPRSLQPGQKIRLSMTEKESQPVLFALPQQPVTTNIEPSAFPAESAMASQEESRPDVVDNHKVKTSPKALKLPYSEQNVARLQYPENNPSAIAPSSVATAVVPGNNTRIEVPPSSESLKSDRTIESSVTEWIWPTTGKLLASFSKNSKGVKISGKAGQPILASASGEVVYSGHGLRGYGNLIIIKHDNTFLSAYAHNSKLLVKEGEVVVKGQKIAEMGNTDTDTIQLHFEIRKHGKPVDPLEYLPSQS